MQKPEQEQQGLAELSGRELVLLHLLKVLNSYACCFPGTMSKAHFNAWQLLPQVCHAHASLQCDHSTRVSAQK